MEIEKTLLVPQDVACFWRDVLAHRRQMSDTPDEGVIISFSVKFEDDCEADLNLCAGSESGNPFVDPVLFDQDGNEIACGEPDSETLEGEYEWYIDGVTYRLTVEVET